VSEPRTCRVCGCTDLQACSPPCSWAAADLCTACDDSPWPSDVGWLNAADFYQETVARDPLAEARREWLNQNVPDTQTPPFVDVVAKVKVL
jgi:hypothetical protein